MSNDTASTPNDVADARARFDEACEGLRPELHRFCTRMVGNPCDGEDILHDALVLAFYRYGDLRDGTSFRSWLFRIAHNKCIDFLRGRRRFEALEDHAADEDGGRKDVALDDEIDHKTRAARTLAHIVTELPPKERACIVLKDVLDCSLEETAEITGSNVGAVKAALHRGRDKLGAAEETATSRATRPMAPQHRALIDRYLEAFNRRDWDGVRALLADDARLEVVHRTETAFATSNYFTNYERLPCPWRLAVASVDGVDSIVQFREKNGAWAPHAVVQITIEEDRIAVVRDYVHVGYLLDDCDVR